MTGDNSLIIGLFGMGMVLVLAVVAEIINLFPPSKTPKTNRRNRP